MVEPLTLKKSHHHLTTNLPCKACLQSTTVPDDANTVLREKLGILSPKEIYIPGPEHDNCTLQTDKYYTATQGKGQKSKENDKEKKPEKDGHGAAHAHCVRGKYSSHIHMTRMPSSQGRIHIHEEGQSYGENLENPISSFSGRSDKHDCLKNSHAHCCKLGPPSHYSTEEIHSRHENFRVFFFLKKMRIDFNYL